MATHLPNTFSAQLTLQLSDIKIMPYWGTLHVSVKYYAHWPQDQYWYLCLTHTYSHSNRFSLVPHHTAGMPTTICWQSHSVTAAENFSSFTQSQVCSVHSALVTQPIQRYNSKAGKGVFTDVSNSAALCNMQLAWIHNVNPGALLVTVCMSKWKTSDGCSLQ